MVSSVEACIDGAVAAFEAQGHDARQIRSVGIANQRETTVVWDRDTGEPLEVVGKLLPLAPSKSKLPWAIENLRFCNWCDQLAQKDLNDCPYCGRRMDPLETGD